MTPALEAHRPPGRCPSRRRSGTRAPSQGRPASSPGGDAPISGPWPSRFPCHENTNGFSFVFNSSGSCVDWLESDGEAEAFQALNVSVNASAGMSGIVVSLAEVAKRRASREHVVDGDGELVSHGECSTTAASAGLDAMVGSLEEGA